MQSRYLMPSRGHFDGVVITDCVQIQQLSSSVRMSLWMSYIQSTHVLTETQLYSEASQSF